MATLIIHCGQTQRLNFDGPQRLSELLARAGVFAAQPCGGRGTCGKCAVTLAGYVSAPTQAEQRLHTRLACQAVVTGDAEVTVPVMLPIVQISGGAQRNLPPARPMAGRFGAAIDIGTTTLALLLYDLSTGRCTGAASMQNPQISVAADVIARINAALNGHAASLQMQIGEAIAALLASACAQAGIDAAQVASLVVTGNTTMLYLLTGRNPHSLSRAPFQADCLFDEDLPFDGRIAYLPPCFHAFVGADIACALLASGITRRPETALLCDIGTNGEMALWHRGQLYIASTAAGPAFEGAGITCGVSSIPGAIDRVALVDGQAVCHTIDDQKAVGVCGSGLLDAVAVMLDMEVIDETGYLKDAFALRAGITLTQADIRAVQLAKAAIHAGMLSLLSAAKCTLGDVTRLYLAGGFGSHLNLQNAARIGLFPAELAGRVKVIGNAALDGAARLLMAVRLRDELRQMTQDAIHVRLDGNAGFSARYVDCMLFDDA